MEFFPAHRSEKQRLSEHGVDVESSYLRMMVELAGPKACGIVSASHDRVNRLLAEAAATSGESRVWAARALDALDVPQQEIANAMNVSRMTVHRWLTNT
jgi:hypothetical protein